MGVDTAVQVSRQPCVPRLCESPEDFLGVQLKYRMAAWMLL